ncbi:Rv3235 family protein [Arthrobacter sp. TMN-37]
MATLTRQGIQQATARAPSVRDRPPCTEPPVVEAEAQEARVGGIARAVAQGAVEVLGGSRPASQMSRWLDAASYEKLHLRACLMRSVTVPTGTATATGRCPGSPPDLRAARSVTVRSARLCRVSETAFEAALVVLDRRRARAVALRVEHQRGDWKVTALEIG